MSEGVTVKNLHPYDLYTYVRFLWLEHRKTIGEGFLALALAIVFLALYCIV